MATRAVVYIFRGKVKDLLPDIERKLERRTQ